MGDLYPSTDLSWWLSLPAIVATSLVTLVFAVGTLRRARRRQIAADAASARSPRRPSALREGDAVLTGVVVHADGHAVAVRASIAQHATVSEHRTTTKHTWTEVHRKLEIEPFYLELADKTRVRVLAPPDVELADALDKETRVARDRRILSAELSAGETLWVQGRLERGAPQRPTATGYRGSEYEWQLVPADGKMLLSSEPLGQGLQERAAFHRTAGRLFAAWFVALQVIYLHYYTHAFATSQVATVTAQAETKTTPKAKPTFTVTLDLPDASSREFELHGADYRELHTGSQLVVRRGVLGWELGARPTLRFFTVVIAGLVTFLLATGYTSKRLATRSWFRRKVTHHGIGALP